MASRILVLSPHPAIGEGLERLLSIDGRFEVRRGAGVDQAEELLASWRPDAVLLDAMLLHGPARAPSLTVPTFLLAGTEADANRYLPMVPSARGWLRKDATLEELQEALARAGIAAAPVARRGPPTVVLAGFALAGVAIVVALAWLLGSAR